MTKPASAKYDQLRAMREANYLAEQRRQAEARKAEKANPNRPAAKPKARKKR